MRDHPSHLVDHALVRDVQIGTCYHESLEITDIAFHGNRSMYESNRSEASECSNTGNSPGVPPGSRGGCRPGPLLVARQDNHRTLNESSVSINDSIGSSRRSYQDRETYYVLVSVQICVVDLMLSFWAVLVQPKLACFAGSLELVVQFFEVLQLCRITQAGH